MKIEYAENVTVAVRQYVPRAIVRSGEDVLIDRNHPHAAELATLACDLVDNVELLDADGEKGFKLIARVVELAGEDAGTTLQFAWIDYQGKIRRKEAVRKAGVWFSAWRTHDVEENPDMDDDVVDALYKLGNAAFPRVSGGLRTVYNYAYQQGHKDALADKTVLAKAVTE